ncbi:hypothetical protein ACFW08_05780 [Streptomyces sp. NPDC058960]|uniref:hypothetical protein n=1 Tax=Streptomyces sp. NPDC058960 TaxID=3346679 RepID=UPI0036B1EB28
MINGGTTIHTADGSSVTITPRGIEYDLHVRNARGETIATVVMNADDLAALNADMGEHVDNDEDYDQGYADGYRDGQEAA